MQTIRLGGPPRAGAARGVLAATDSRAGKASVANEDLRKTRRFIIGSRVWEKWARIVRESSAIFYRKNRQIGHKDHATEWSSLRFVSIHYWQGAPGLLSFER